MINPAETFAAPLLTPGTINARIDRLPGTPALWRLVCLVALGGWFEAYDAFLTAYLGPGLVQSGLFTTTTAAFFGVSGLGVFIAATFGGFFIGTFFFGRVADRFGRRSAFAGALVWYSACSALMAFQQSAGSISLCRLLAAVGMGVQLITIDSYLTELVPARLRGRGVALSRVVMGTAIPAAALLSWWLVPRAPWGLQGWRWVVLAGAVVAPLVLAAIWRRLPESPRWLADQGHLSEADEVVTRLERQVAFESGSALPKPTPPIDVPAGAKASLAEILSPAYRGRTAMLMVFNFFQVIGYYGFAHWVPTLLIAKGIIVTKGLFYSFAIALAYPFAALVVTAIIDRVERKSMIVACSLLTVGLGALFAVQRSGPILVVIGVLIVFSNTGMSLGFHTYQAELFPTRIRARAVGLVYSMSRIGGAFSGFLLPYFLHHFGVPGVFCLICGSMVVVAVTIGTFGPRTRGKTLDEIAC